MKPTSLILAVLALAAGLVVAGCGDDDDEPTAATTTEEATGTSGAEAMPKAEWIEAADAICRESIGELADEARSQYPEGPPTGEDAVAFGEDVVIPNFQAQHDQIAALPPPEGEEEAAADLLATLQSGIDELAEDPGNFVESTALEDAGQAASEFGLRQCGS